MISIFIIVLVIMMVQPNQLFRMANTNGQAMVPLDFSTNYGLPPPYCVNEGGCTNATHETATGHD